MPLLLREFRQFIKIMSDGEFCSGNWGMRAANTSQYISYQAFSEHFWADPFIIRCIVAQWPAISVRYPRPTSQFQHPGNIKTTAIWLKCFVFSLSKIPPDQEIVVLLNSASLCPVMIALNWAPPRPRPRPAWHGANVTRIARPNITSSNISVSGAEGDGAVSCDILRILETDHTDNHPVTRLCV